MKKWCLLFFFCVSTLADAQISFRVMTYNVENLFDLLDNPQTEDSEFLPGGDRNWSAYRYYTKLQHVSKVVLAAGEWETPALVALQEVESDSVLTDLLTKTGLRTQYYRYCMTTGSDSRGINVALLYQRDKFRYITHQELVVVLPEQRRLKGTRNILHVSGELVSGDTLDVFVCHFPSKYGGELETRGDRVAAANTLRQVCDSLYRVRLEASFLIMGDLNETPDCEVVSEILVGGKKPSGAVYVSGKFCNLVSDCKVKNGIEGSHKYRGSWSFLDHLIVSRNMLLAEPSGIRYVAGTASLFSPSFILTTDKTWLGVRPFRTYYGFKYEKGYSDHLPVVADFVVYPE